MNQSTPTKLAVPLRMEPDTKFLTAVYDANNDFVCHAPHKTAALIVAQLNAMADVIEGLDRMAANLKAALAAGGESQ